MLRQCLKCGTQFEGRSDASLCPKCADESKRSVMRERTCKQCGKKFVGGPRAWYCPECRIERHRESDRKHRREGTKRPIGSIDNCIICGKEYIVNAAKQKYCPECSAAAIAEIDRRQAKEWYQQNGDSQKRKQLRHDSSVKKICPICGKEFMPHDPSKTCSEECRELYKKQICSEWERNHREERNLYRKTLNERKENKHDK